MDKIRRARIPRGGYRLVASHQNLDIILSRYTMISSSYIELTLPYADEWQTRGNPRRIEYESPRMQCGEITPHTTTTAKRLNSVQKEGLTHQKTL